MKNNNPRPAFASFSSSQCIIKKFLLISILLTASPVYTLLSVTTMKVTNHPNGRRKEAVYFLGSKQVASEEFDPNEKLIKTTGKIPDGKIQSFYDSGKLKSESFSKNGKREGETKYFYESGKLKGHLNVKNGKREGIYKEIYESGKVKVLAPFKDDHPEGATTAYYENGISSAVWNYKDGQLHGTTQLFYENGVLKSEEPYVNNRLEGALKNYYPSGKLWGEWNFKNGKIEGIGKKYYETGALWIESNWKDGKQEGILKEYFQSGKLKGEFMYEQNRLNGAAKQFTEFGDLIGYGYYKNNMIVGAPSLFKDGKILETFIYLENFSEAFINYFILRMQGSRSIGKFLSKMSASEIRFIIYILILAPFFLFFRFIARFFIRKFSAQSNSDQTFGTPPANFKIAMPSSSQNFETFQKSESFEPMTKPSSKQPQQKTESPLKTPSAILSGHEDSVTALSFSSDGKRLYSVSEDQTIRIWDTDTGNTIQQFPVDNDIIGIRGIVPVSNEHIIVYTCADTDVVKIFEFPTGKEIKKFEQEEGGEGCAAFTSDGKLMSLGWTDLNTIQLWDLANMKMLNTMTFDDTGVYALCFSYDGHILASVSISSIKIWDVQSGKELRGMPLGEDDSDDIFTIASDWKGTIIATGSGDGTVRIWDGQWANETGSFKAYEITLRALALSPDGKTVATSSDEDCSIKLWKV